MGRRFVVKWEMGTGEFLAYGEGEGGGGKVAWKDGYRRLLLEPLGLLPQRGKGYELIIAPRSRLRSSNRVVIPT